MANDVQDVLERCRRVGVHAGPSKLYPGGVLGGLTQGVDNGVVWYQQSFALEPQGAKIRAVVPGPGNGAEEVLCDTFDQGLDWVLQTYRTRGWLP